VLYGQITINALITASSYILAGISFYITYSVARFYHFTHGAFFALGAYFSYILVKSTGTPLIIAILIVTVTLGFTAMAMDWLIYRRIRHFDGGAFIPLLASLGIYTIIQNTISMSFGDSALTLPMVRYWGVLDVIGGRITVAQIIQLSFALLALFLSWLMMKRTLTGQKMRAVGQDRSLSLALGIPVDNIVSLSFGLGYSLAAISGAIAAANVDLTPTMGMRPMMMGMVAMIIGGNTLWGTVRGAILLALAQHVGVIWIPTQWQDVIAFMVLILVLLFRPTIILINEYLIKMKTAG
jgi:branched-chain amino acid transport system permease protein